MSSEERQPSGQPPDPEQNQPPLTILQAAILLGKIGDIYDRIFLWEQAPYHTPPTAKPTEQEKDQLRAAVEQINRAKFSESQLDNALSKAGYSRASFQSVLNWYSKDLGSRKSGVNTDEPQQPER